MSTRPLPDPDYDDLWELVGCLSQILDEAVERGHVPASGIPGRLVPVLAAVDACPPPARS